MPADDAAATTMDAPPAGPNQLTETGYKRLMSELEMLRTQQRPQLLAAIRRTRLLSVPSASLPIVDNIQVDLQLADERIAELERILADVQIIGDGPVPETVQLGWGVTVRYDDEVKAEQILTVVGPLEADLLRGYITAESPVGRALLDKGVGAKVKVDDGTDTVELTVVSIEKARPDGEV